MLELCFNENLGRELIYLNSYKRRNGEKYNDVLPLDFRLDCGCLTNGAFSEERFKYLKALSKDKWMGNKAFLERKIGKTHNRLLKPLRIIILIQKRKF